MTDKLPEKQKLFCSEYLKDFNGTRAYEFAYKSKGGKKPKGAAAAASRLLRNVKVCAYLAEKTKKLLDKADLDTVDMLKHFMKIAFTPASEYVEKIDTKNGTLVLKDLNEFDSSIVDGVQVKHSGLGGKSIEYKMVSKEFALKMLANYAGGFSDRVDHTSGNAPLKQPLVIEVNSEKTRKNMEDAFKTFGKKKNAKN